MKKVRQMPKAGFYVRNVDPEWDRPGDIDVIYTTGIPGKGGHMYYRILFGTIPDSWATLTWTCVPGLKDMEKNYTYYENEKDLPKNIPPKPEKK